MQGSIEVKKVGERQCKMQPFIISILVMEIPCLQFLMDMEVEKMILRFLNKQICRRDIYQGAYG